MSATAASRNNRPRLATANAPTCLVAGLLPEPQMLAVDAHVGEVVEDVRVRGKLLGQRELVLGVRDGVLKRVTVRDLREAR